MSFTGPYGVAMLTLIFVQLFPRSDDRRTQYPPAKSSAPITASEWMLVRAMSLSMKVQFFTLSVERKIPQGMGTCDSHFVPAKRLPPMAARAVIFPKNPIGVQFSPLSVEQNMYPPLEPAKSVSPTAVKDVMSGS